MITSKENSLGKAETIWSKILLIQVFILLAMSSAEAQESLFSVIPSSMYQIATPTMAYVDKPDDYNAGSLTSTLFVSDEEIWFSGKSEEGKPWLIRGNRKGEVSLAKVLDDAPGNRSSVQCLSKAADTLLMGIIDYETQHGTVAIMQDGQLQVSYHSIGDGKVSEMIATQDGIVALGVRYDDSSNTVATTLTLIDKSGNINFQITGQPYDMRIDNGALSSSHCFSVDDKHYVQLNIGVESKFLPDRNLTCLAGDGTQLWSRQLPENVVVLEMSADDNHIYLMGIIGDLLPDGVLSNQKAMILCYSHDGSEKWIKSFEEPSLFQRGSAGYGVCVAANMEDGYWYLCMINADGSVQNMKIIDAEAQYINSIAIDADGSVRILGMTDEQILIADIIAEEKGATSP